MASTIRVRATSNGDITEVQALIQHPMDSGFVKDAQGALIPPHFIQELTF
jgi:sulfur-oxidizing protein SoxZ